MDPCIASSPRIALGVTGTPRALTADVVQSPHQGNIAQNRGDGLYVPGLEWLTNPSFHSQPDDGMIAALSPTNGVSWQFRFNAASTAVHQWEFIGGGSWYANVETSGSFQPSGANNWVTLSGSDIAGPDITPPIDGVYRIRFGASVNAAIDANATNGGVAQIGISIGGADPSGNFVASSGNVNVVTVSRSIDTSVSGGQRVRLMYRDSANSSGPTSSFGHRWIEVTPIRVA